MAKRQKSRRKSSPSNPLCYQCKHRGDLTGDAHSRCCHKAVTFDGPNILGLLLGTLDAMTPDPELQERTIGQGDDIITVRFSKHGIEGGWANWPWNFDPVWLEWCDGFKKDSTKK